MVSVLSGKTAFPCLIQFLTSIPEKIIIRDFQKFENYQKCLDISNKASHNLNQRNHHCQFPICIYKINSKII